MSICMMPIRHNNSIGNFTENFAFRETSAEEVINKIRKAGGAGQANAECLISFVERDDSHEIAAYVVAGDNGQIGGKHRP